MKMLRLMFLVFVFNTTAAFAQDQPAITHKLLAQPVDKTRGKNPNIKKDKPTTDEVQTTSKSRGNGDGNCSILFTNYTGYYIDIYVDGYYKSTIGTMNYCTVYVGDGYTTVYCISSDGTKEWKDSGNCSSFVNETLYIYDAIPTKEK